MQLELLQPDLHQLVCWASEYRQISGSLDHSDLCTRLTPHLVDDTATFAKQWAHLRIVNKHANHDPGTIAFLIDLISKYPFEQLQKSFLSRYNIIIAAKTQN